MADKFTITRTQNSVYLDRTGKAINGYSLSVYLPEFDEELTIQVSSLDTKVVQDACNKLYASRSALSNLGKS